MERSSVLFHFPISALVKDPRYEKLISRRGRSPLNPYCRDDLSNSYATATRFPASPSRSSSNAPKPTLSLHPPARVLSTSIFFSSFTFVNFPTWLREKSSVSLEVAFSLTNETLMLSCTLSAQLIFFFLSPHRSFPLSITLRVFQRCSGPKPLN